MAFGSVLNLAGLDPSTGFSIEGEGDNDYSGAGAVGDINGDGFADLAISASMTDPGGRLFAGSVWVVFGHARPFGNINLGAINGTNGFRIDGLAVNDSLVVRGMGDINGDGFADLLMRSFSADPAGAVYVVYGKAGGFGASVDLAGLNGANGFRIPGPVAGQKFLEASMVGDVNGDGVTDFALEAQGPASDVGQVYIVYGRPQGFGASLDLTSVTPAQGVIVSGVANGDSLDVPVAAGDVNGDGIGDLVFTIDAARVPGRPTAGTAYVVFGKSGGFGAGVDLAGLNGANGFKVHGTAGSLQTLYGVGAGDFNGDGVGDLAFSATMADPGGRTDAGEVSLVLGRRTGQPAVVDLTALTGADGGRFEGVLADDRTGALRSAGDVNGDGFDDLTFGAPGRDLAGSSAGEAYLVFGTAQPLPAVVGPQAPPPPGFGIVTIPGLEVFGLLGSGGLGGDIDRDGLSDIILAAQDAPGGFNDPGVTYAIFGQGSGASTAGADSFTGSAAVDRFNGLGGDDTVRGDGGDDVFRGGAGADTGVYGAASANYEWWGRPDGTWRVKDLRTGSPDGTDTLTAFERLQFGDRTVKLTGLTTAEKLTDAYANVLRSTATGAELTFLNNLIGAVNGSTKTLSAAISEIVAKADGTTAVAALSYQFFAGFVPSKGGFDYLVSPQGPNPNNINSAYYQSFSLENRYINFAVNLGKLGEGAAGFLSEYGSKTLFEATKSAYSEIFGGTVVDSKINTILDTTFQIAGQTVSRAQYFAIYGGDGLTGIGTKAAMVGWLLTEAAKADLGMYAQSSNAFLTDLADGAETLIDLVGAYGRSDYVFNG